MKDALRVGAGMTQIGEFSFVIAAMGVSQKVVESSLFPIIVSVSILTTLTTPWFIKGSEAGAGFIEKHSPKFLLSYLNLYYDWTSRFNVRRQSNAVQQILQRIFIQLAVFCCLIAGAFVMALFLARILPTVLPMPEPYIPWMETGLWLAALLLTMPVILASLRKLKALSMILAELGITESVAGPRWREIRNILTSFFYLLGVGMLLIYGMLLSSAILPPKALFLLAGIVIPLVWLLRDAFNKIYFQGKAAIVGPLAKPGRKEKHTKPTGSPSQEDSPSPGAEKPQASADWEIACSLKNALIVLLQVREGAPIANQKISETPLEKNNVVRILAVQRPGALRVHPGPEEELKPGDEVLLLGEPSGLVQIRPLFEPQSLSPAKNSELPITKVFPVIRTPS
jgi:CPA2 family monovalent cation:H+ antiporter-2